MISFWRIFSLEFIALVRSRTLALLAVAAAGWMLVLPVVMKGDGTAEGARQMYVHYSLGGVFALLVVALLASATGSIAGERSAKRLQLTLVRPVRGAALVLAKGLAHVLVGALVLALASLMLAFRVDLSVPCNHVLRPVLPAPRAEAEAMYDAFMQDPDTPDAVKHASRSTVLRLLETRAVDHYQTIVTNETSTWRFPLDEAAGALPLRVRMRFTNAFEMRQEVRGTFRLGGAFATVSNYTQAVTLVPLTGCAGGAAELTFDNCGTSPLMLRPRKDLELLVAADAFGWNLLRTYVELVSLLALAVAFGLFLSAGLGRPVALFVAIVTLAVSEMSPSIVEQYPDELETKTSDRLGLLIARSVSELTHPVAALSPLARLSSDECVEPRELGRVLAVDIVILPALLALVAAFLLPRKQDEGI